MADKKISALDPTVLLTGDELIAIVQPAVTPPLDNKKITINNLIAAMSLVTADDVWKAATGVTLTGNNLVTLGAYSFTMDIGGSLASFDTTDGTFRVRDLGTVGYASFDFSGGSASGFEVFAGTGANYADFKLGLTTNQSARLVHTGSVIFEDQRGTPRGVEYLADYSATFNDNSLVTKAYVTSLTGATGAWKLASGGTLTGVNNFAMAGYDINFLNGDILIGPTGATITANTRVDIRGITDDASTSAFRVASGPANSSCFRVSGNGDVFIGAGESFIVGQNSIYRNSSANYLQIGSDPNITAYVNLWGETHATYPGRSWYGSRGHYFLQYALSSAWQPILTITPGAHTSMTASTEFISNDFAGVTWQWIAGTVTTQRFNYFRGFTVTGASATATLTNAYTLYVDPPVAGTNATITNNWAAGFAGNVQINGSNSLYVGTTGNSIVQIFGTGGALFAQGWQYYSNNTNMTVFTPTGATSNILDIGTTTAWAQATLDWRFMALRSGVTTSEVASRTFRSLAIIPTHNISAGTHLLFGVDYNPSVTSLAGVASHYAFRSTSGGVLLAGGLTTADVGATLTANTKLDVRGIGTSSTTITQRWGDSANTLLGQIHDNGAMILSNSYQGGRSATDSKLFIKGLGSTAGTFNIITFNSSNSQLFYVDDTGQMSVTVGQHFFSSGNTSVQISAATGGASNNGLLIRAYSGVAYAAANDYNFVAMSGGWTNNNGTATYRQLSLLPTYNITGTYSGNVYGIDYNPTLTSMTGVTHYAIRTTSGQILFANSSSEVVLANTRLDVRGSGSSSTTFSFRAANSSNATIFSVRDDGQLTHGGTSFFASTGVTDNYIWSKTAYSGTSYSFAYQANQLTGNGGGAVWYLASLDGTGANGNSVVTIDVSANPGSAASGPYRMLRIGTFAGGLFNQNNYNSLEGIFIGNITYSPSSGSAPFRAINIRPTFNVTGGTRDIVGFNYDPTNTSMTGVTHYSFRATSGTMLLPASIAGAAPFRIPHGTAPSSPVDGDFWSTTAGFYVRVNGVTVGPLGAGGGGAISALTAATGSNSINNTFYAQTWSWDSLAGGNGLTLSANTTLAASNTQTLFQVTLSGANGTSTQTTKSAFISNSHSGTSSTNIALQLSATSGTNNYALHITGGLAAINYAEADLASATRQLNVRANDGSNTSITYVSKFVHHTTGAPGAGIGVGVEFEVETASDNFEIGAIIEAVTTDVTSTSEDFDIVFKNMTGGAAATEKVRITSLGVVQIGATASAYNTSSLTSRGDFIVERASADAFEPNIVLHKNRGTYGSPSVITTGDTLGGIKFRGRSTTTDIISVAIQAQSFGTIGAGSIPTKVTLSTGATGFGTHVWYWTTDGYTGIGIDPGHRLHIKALAASTTTKAINLDNTSVNNVFYVTEEGKATGVDFIATSDARLKDDVRPFTDGLAVVLGVAKKARTYRWKHSSIEEVGFVAQELATVAPQYVSTGNEDDQMWGVNYAKMVVPLYGAIDTVHHQLMSLKETVDQELDRLKRRIDQLESKLAA